MLLLLRSLPALLWPIKPLSSSEQPPPPALLSHGNPSCPKTLAPPVLSTWGKPSVGWAHMCRYKKPEYFNFQVEVGEEEPEEVLLRRFASMTRKTGIRQECRRRMFFENPREKRKRKAREAAQKYRRKKWPFWLKSKMEGERLKREEEEERKKEKYCSDDDNWELPPDEKLP